TKIWVWCLRGSPLAPNSHYYGDFYILTIEHNINPRRNRPRDQAPLSRPRKTADLTMSETTVESPPECRCRMKYIPGAHGEHEISCPFRIWHEKDCAKVAKP